MSTYFTKNLLNEKNNIHTSTSSREKLFELEGVNTPSSMFRSNSNLKKSIAKFGSCFWETTKVITTILVLLFSTSVTINAQNQDYWQQKCDYEIEVTLDDQQNKLDAFIKIQYTNNSPDDLKEMYFHAWPNAFKTQNSAFAKQQVENGLTEFYHATTSQKGEMFGLDFTVNDKKVAFTETDQPDIIKLELQELLKSGESINITTPFKVKIPESFSRLGRVGQSYQITQWYPKPAVYDQNGWHPMPYVSQGEFYSEFGSFDVKITLPENYVVGSTGDLQTESEINFLNDLAAKTAKIQNFELSEEFPASSPKFKTLHYKQNNVHDFAWFADKRFHVLKEDFKITNGETVTAWAMFTNTEAELWKEATKYIKEGIKFYSEKVAPYPFKQATAVQSALSAGAGMEYPNVTIIGLSETPLYLETVIVHEVGHNWFYGQLASNERDYPWMDEGINSYYEQRYFREIHPGVTEDLFGLPPEIAEMLGWGGKTTRDNYEILYQSKARFRDDQPIQLHSMDYTDSNYGNIVYLKSVLAFNYLEAYLGMDELDRIIRKYYKEFEFKHPYPEDIRAIFEAESKKPIDWFFDELIETDKRVNYWLYKIKKEGEKIGNDYFDKITVRNHPYHNVAGPFPITAIKNEKPIKTIWYDGFHGQEEVLFPSMEYDYLVIDNKRQLPEFDRHNNFLKPKGLFKKAGLEVGIIPKFENNYKKQLFINPTMGFNKYDGFMLGAVFYNDMLPPRRPLSYALAPMFGFKSQSLVGMGEIRYNLFPKNGPFKNIEIGVGGRSFMYDNVIDTSRSIGETTDEREVRYSRIVPELKFQLKEKSKRSSAEKFIRLRHISLFTDELDDKFLKPLNHFDKYRYVNEVSLIYNNTNILRPHGFNLSFQQATEYMLGTAEAKYAFKYANDSKLSFRVFGGYFFDNESADLTKDLPRAFLNLSGTGIYDINFEKVYFGRSEIDGFWGRQIYNNTGGFRVASSIGKNFEWLFAVNIESGIPLINSNLPIRLFADIGLSPEVFDGFVDGESVYTTKTLYDFGVSISLLEDNIRINVPLFWSKDFDTSLGTKFFKRITYNVNLNGMNPFKYTRKLKI